MTGTPDPGASRAATRSAVLVMWLAAALLALCVSPHWRVGPDSALYTGMARSIATGRGYTFAGEVQTSIGPAVPLYLALVYKAAHAVDPGLKFLDTFIFWNSSIALAAMAGIVAAYFLARRKAPSDALLVLLLLATSSRLISAAITPLTDVPHAAACWAALLFLARSEASGRAADRVLAALFLAVAVLARGIGVTLVAAAGLVYLSQMARSRVSRREGAARLATIAPGAIAAAVLFAFIFAGAGSGTFNYVTHITSDRSACDMLACAVSNVAGIPAYLFESLFGLESIAGLGLLLTAVCVLGALVHWRSGERLIVVYPVMYLVFVASAYPVIPRYFVPLLPLVYLFLIAGLRAIFAAVGARLAERGKGFVAERAIAVFVAVAVAANLVYVGKEVALNFSGDFYARYRHGKYLDYFPLAAALIESPPRKVMAYEARILSALSGVDATTPSTHFYGVRRASEDDVEDYAGRREVDAIVVHPLDGSGVDLVYEYVDASPRWRETARFGRLILYRRVEEPVSDADRAP